MNPHPASTRVPEKTMRKLFDSCIAYKKGEIELRQLWYRLRGERKRCAFLHLPDAKLSQLLFTLSMDFDFWYGDRDDIVHRSAIAVANALESRGKVELKQSSPPLTN